MAAVLVLNTPDDGHLRPKHVEWLCRNKTCTVLHQVGVSLDDSFYLCYSVTLHITVYFALCCRNYNQQNILHVTENPPRGLQCASDKCQPFCVSIKKLQGTNLSLSTCMTFILRSKLFIILDETAIPSNIVENVSGLKSHPEYTGRDIVNKSWIFFMFVWTCVICTII